MSVSAAGIIFSSLNNNTLSRLTGDRTVAAIPFACRYRLVDFCLRSSSLTVLADLIASIFICFFYLYITTATANVEHFFHILTTRRCFFSDKTYF